MVPAFRPKVRPFEFEKVSPEKVLLVVPALTARFPAPPPPPAAEAVKNRHLSQK